MSSDSPHRLIFLLRCLDLPCRRFAAPSNSRLQLLEERKSLPVHQASSDLREILAAHNVIIIVGETGSGKTTQV
jgi:HrpA-like RNA helicase